MTRARPSSEAVQPPRSGASSSLVSVALAAVVVVSAALSLVQAAWVAGLQLLVPLALGGVLLGAAFARLRLPALLLHLVGVLLGEAVALRLVAATLPPPSWGEQVALLASRFSAWLAVVRTGGTANDNLLFLLSLALLAWFVGYSASFMVVRGGTPWWAVTTGGAALLTNVAYSGRPLPYVPLFLVAALLLVAQLSAAAQERAWHRVGLSYSRWLPASALPVGLIVSLTLVVATFLLPSSSAAESAERLRTLGAAGAEPLTELKAELQRLFSGVTGATPERGGFNDQMTLQSEFRGGPEIVADVSAPRGRYWRAVTYQDYTGRGWRAAPDQTARGLEPNERHTSAYQARADFEQRVTVRAPRGDALIAAGQPLVVGIPATLEFPGRAGGDPLALDLVGALRSPRARVTGASYTIASSVSTADEAALRAAGASYPATIRERYGQPPELPERVRALARQLAPADATPYDRAKSVEAYLRTLRYELKVPAPPPGRDGVDFFLFDSKTGYCDYFASAMAALLRSSGVPARVVSGYAMGDFDPTSGRWVVRDQHAHSWAEVYFPRYGWIDFEPSPIRPLPARGRLGTSAPLATATHVAAATPTVQPAGTRPASPRPTTKGAEQSRASAPSAAVALIVLALMLAALLGAAAWLFLHWGIDGLRPTEAPYARLARLARLLGRGPSPAQTPHEFAERLGPAATVLADAYVRSRWSGRGDAEGLDEAWREVRRALLSSLLPLAMRRQRVRGGE